MSLSIRHQWSLRRIEYSLLRSDRQFAAMMSALTVFALDGEMPQHERLGSRRAWGYRVILGLFVRAMMLCAHAVHMLWFALRGAGVWLAAALRSGRAPHHSGSSGAGGSGHRTLR